MSSLKAYFPYILSLIIDFNVFLFAYFKIMSLHPRYISFLWQVADLGSSLNMPPLRDGARVLMKLMPPG